MYSGIVIHVFNPNTLETGIGDLRWWFCIQVYCYQEDSDKIDEDVDKSKKYVIVIRNCFSFGFRIQFKTTFINNSCSLKWVPSSAN